MRLLTDTEREVLREVGEPFAGPVPDETFAWAIGQGYGRWGPEFWEVTAAGRRALELDDLARASLPPA